MKKFIFLLILIVTVNMKNTYSQQNNNIPDNPKIEKIQEGTSKSNSKDENKPRKNNSPSEETKKYNTCLFFATQILFLLLVFFGYPLFCRSKRYFLQNENVPPLKGLNLPKGSVRAMIAIAIIGSYLITLSLGSIVMPSGQFDKIIAAFGSLVGAVVGFYFGSRNNDSGSGYIEQSERESKNKEKKLESEHKVNNTAPPEPDKS